MSTLLSENCKREQWPLGNMEKISNHIYSLHSVLSQGGVLPSFLLSFHEVLLALWVTINFKKPFWKQPPDKSHSEVLTVLLWKAGWAKQRDSSSLATLSGLSLQQKIANRVHKTRLVNICLYHTDHMQGKHWYFLFSFLSSLILTDPADQCLYHPAQFAAR